MSAPLLHYRLAKLLIEARYFDVWFRNDGARLILTGTPAALPPDLMASLKAHKPAIAAALATIPPECPTPTAHLLTGCCVNCSCGIANDQRNAA